MLKTYLVLSLFLFAFLIEAQRVAYPREMRLPYIMTQRNKKCRTLACDGLGALYDKSTLTLSWPGYFCRNGCNEGYDNWSGQTFGVHGYWPSKDNDRCIRQRLCPDPNCVYNYFIGTNANEALIQNLKEELDVYWPQWGFNNANTFRSDEWNKHGTCYMKRILEAYPGKYSKDQIFKYYFTSTIQKTKQYRTVSQPRYASKQEFGKSIGLDDPSTFYIACQDKPYNSKKCIVKEIQICYTLTAPRTQTLTNCYFYDESGYALYPQEIPNDVDYEQYVFLNHKDERNIVSDF